MDSKNRPCWSLGLLLWVGCTVILVWTLYSSPAWFQLQRIELTPEIGSSVTLGQSGLAAGDADIEHLQVTHLSQFEWRFFNLSHEKKLLLIDSKGVERWAREWPLLAGSAFRIGSALFEIIESKEDQLHLLQSLGDEDQHWLYDGQSLMRGGVLQALCPDAGIRQNVTHFLNGTEYSQLKINQSLGLGGGLYCGNRLGIAGTPPDGLEIINRSGHFYLRFGRGANIELGAVWLSTQGVMALSGESKMLAHQAGVEQLRNQFLTPQDGDQLIVGHSRYQVTVGDERLIITPLRRTERTLTPTVSPQDEVSQVWTKSSLWLPSQPLPVKLAGLWFCGLLAIGFIWLLKPSSTMHHRAPRWQRFFMLSALLLGGFSFLGYYRADVIPVSWTILVTWSALLTWALLPWRRMAGRIVMLMQLLLSIGLLVQLHLGLGATESHWLSYATKSAGLAGAFLWSAWAVYRYKTYGAVKPAITRINGGAIVGLFTIAITAMMLQAAFGSESGVAGIQPVEFAKLALLAGAAYALAYMRRWQAWNREISPWRLWAVMLMPILLMLGLMTVALFLLRDFSPLVLILFWALAIAWAYQKSLPNKRDRRVGLLTILLLVLGGVVFILLLKQHPYWLGFLAQSDRILTWAEPHLHPHSGDQVRQAINILLDGGRLGQWLNDKPLSVGVTPVQVMSLPAIQDDFILAFAVNKFGVMGGMVIFTLQLSLVFAVVQVAKSIYQHHVLQGKGDHHQVMLGWFGYFFLYGGAGFLLGHILVSWGTNSGLLPVMGQPSFFISAAGSHLIFFIFPLLITSMIFDQERVDA